MENNGKRLYRNLGVYLAILILGAIIIWIAMRFSAANNDYTYEDFKTDLVKNDIEAMVIIQNEQVPTGQVRLVMKDGSTRSFYVIDTLAVFNDAMANGISPQVRDVKTQSVFLTGVLPYLLIIVVLFVFMSSMSIQSGGGNSKMLNFGRSRARMVGPDGGKTVTFKDVAGFLRKSTISSSCSFSSSTPATSLKVTVFPPSGPTILARLLPKLSILEFPPPL